MPMRRSLWVLLAVVLLSVMPALVLADGVTIVLNGYPNVGGARVHGPGVSLVIPEGAEKAVVTGTKASQIYTVTFAGQSGEGSANFSFAMNENNKGVAFVDLGGQVHEVVKNFQPGSSTLLLNTRRITLNANSGQTAQFLVIGLAKTQSMKLNPGPIDVMALPGVYAVDNVQNGGAGNEDYRFTVNDRGIVGAVPGSEEHAAFEGSSIKPRAVMVQYIVEAPKALHVISAYPPVTSEFENGMLRHVIEARVAIGSGGINVASFGNHTVDESNLIKPDGKPLKGDTSKNDLLFRPRMRFAADKGYFFDTTDGPSQTVTATASGFYDDNITPLQVTVKATILQDTAGPKP